MSVEQSHWARKILDDFIKECAKYNKKYFPQVPWDVRDLEEVLEYYDKGFLIELLQGYAKNYSDPTIKHFCNNIQAIAKAHTVNIENDEAFKEKMAATKRKMKK